MHNAMTRLKTIFRIIEKGELWYVNYISRKLIKNNYIK